MLIVSLAVRLVLRFCPLGCPNPAKRTSPWCLSRVLRLGRSAAQILQNGPLHRALCQLGCAPFGAPFSLCCSVFPAHRPKSSTTDLLFSLLRSLTPFSKCTSELLSGIPAHHAREPNAKMKQVCYIATHVHTSVCMNVGTCVCMRRVSVLLCVGAMYPRVRYDMIWCMWERMHAPHTTLHQGQFFCDVLLGFTPPFITILFVRNCFPTSFDDMMYVRTHACATSPLCALLDSQTLHIWS